MFFMNKVKSRPVGRPRRIAKGELRRVTLTCSEREYALICELSELVGNSMNCSVLAAVERLHDSISRRADKAAKQSSAA